MQRILETAVRQWTKLGRARIPRSVGIVCPHCGERVVFALSNHYDDKVRLAVAATAPCPGCAKKVHFVIFRAEENPKDDNKNPEAIYYYPKARNYYPSPKFEADIPEALERSLVSTLDAFNSKNYTATAVCCRRTLEGLFKYLLPEAKRNLPLHKAIAEVQRSTDLAAPLSSLSHAIRQGGNLGAHFDMEKEPDEDLARKMVELVVYLISYLYVLPKEIQNLEGALGNDA